MFFFCLFRIAVQFSVDVKCLNLSREEHVLFIATKILQFRMLVTKLAKLPSSAAFTTQRFGYDFEND